MTATLVRDDTARAVDRCSYTAADRADMLRRIASRWDENIRTHEANHPHISRDTIIDGLYLAMSEYADPGLTMTQVRGYTDALIDTCNALTRYELGDGWDGDEDDDKCRYSQETVVGILNTDIDYTLFPLVYGMDEDNACRRCERMKKGAAFWNVREPGSAYCTDCKAGQ